MACLNHELGGCEGCVGPNLRQVQARHQAMIGPAFKYIVIAFLIVVNREVVHKKPNIEVNPHSETNESMNKEKDERKGMSVGKKGCKKARAKKKKTGENEKEGEKARKRKIKRKRKNQNARTGSKQKKRQRSSADSIVENIPIRERVYNRNSCSRGKQVSHSQASLNFIRFFLSPINHQG